MDLERLPNKKIMLGTEARQKIKEGVEELANVVKVTLGPKGQTVILDLIGS